MKRKAFMAIAAMLLMSPVAFASSIQDVKPQSSIKNLPVCQPSLSKYVGKVSGVAGSFTESFRVRINCAQEKDVTYTVFVYIDNQCVASKTFTITKGYTESGDYSICLADDERYKGKSYSLKVE